MCIRDSTYFGGITPSTGQMFIGSKVNFEGDDNHQFDLELSQDILTIGSENDYVFGVESASLVSVIHTYEDEVEISGGERDIGQFLKNDSASLDNVIYTGNSKNHYDVMEKTEKSFIADLPWETLPLENLRANLVKSNSSEQPDNVSLDPSINSLELNATELKGEKIHSFEIFYNDGDQELLQFDFNVTVRECKVPRLSLIHISPKPQNPKTPNEEN